MGAGADWLGTYHAAGMHYLYLGDEALVDCQSFSLEGGKMFQHYIDSKQPAPPAKDTNG